MPTPVLDRTREAIHAYSPASATPDRLTAEWSPARRVGFRFVFAYLVLYSLPFPIGTLPLTAPIRGWYDKLWHLVVPWFGAHVLHLAKPVTIFTNGSGDTTYDYVLLLVNLTIAGLAAVIWTLLDRRARAYPRLALGLRIYVRYVLAFALLAYGSFKVIQTQFPYPPLDRLVEPYGEFSPMGVVWSWMGASYAYNLFAGLAEMTSGFLLFFRRTTMLGALLGIAVMGNVVVINFAYDVPVKLYSSHLLLMAIFLVAPDAKRLVDACLLNRAIPSAELGETFSTKRARVSARVLKTALVVAGVAAPLWQSWGYSKQIAIHPPLYGIWEVDSFVRGHEALPPILGDSLRWRRFVVSFPGGATIRLLNDSTRRFRAQVDSVKRTITLTSRQDSSRTTFRYARLGLFDDTLALDGLQGRDSLHIRLRRLDETRFLLVNRGFHWINEFPLNR